MHGGQRRGGGGGVSEREGWNQPKVFQGEAARRTTISSKSRAAALLSRLLAQLSDSISFHSSVPESQDAEPKRTEAATGIAGTVPSEENRRVRVCVCMCVYSVDACVSCPERE